MAKEKTYMGAMIKGKCPRCREGNLFTYPIGKISKFNVMNKTCPACGVGLEPEPGFYQGAMYVGYGFTMMIIIAISLLLYIVGGFSDMAYATTVIGIMVLLIPFNYRYSRILYLYLLGGIKYNPDASRSPY